MFCVSVVDRHPLKWSAQFGFCPCYRFARVSGEIGQCLSIFGGQNDPEVATIVLAPLLQAFAAVHAGVTRVE